MQFICTNCCLDSTSTAPSEEVSWRQRTGEHMIHLWNATDPRHHHHAWVNLIYLLGLHGGCKCCLPAPTKAHATAGQSRSAMQVSAYLSNITACSLILKILEKILEMSEMTTPTPQCLWFFFFFFYRSCDCLGMLLQECHKLGLLSEVNTSCLTAKRYKFCLSLTSLALKFLLINITQSISSSNPLPLQIC